MEFACQICQLMVLDVQAPRIEQRARLDLALQPKPGYVDFLFAGQTAPPAFEPSQTRTGNSDHGFFASFRRAASTARTRDSEEEKFWPIPLR
jgi:hypothetical protein